ncbi:hypothetical protein ZOSMA_43G00670 [Zostera marina]|uniref:Uncharacterized protein n=1 Tax=Zostera marina TaxID=29655 RepID=A0A0K9P3S4_ZOSMR|nr:hypothetical protein ZOSMA_43G00670 [Zostera marina]
MNGNERFFLSCDINLPVTFKIGSFEGSLPESNRKSFILSVRTRLYRYINETLNKL